MNVNEGETNLKLTLISGSKNQVVDEFQYGRRSGGCGDNQREKFVQLGVAILVHDALQKECPAGAGPSRGENAAGAAVRIGSQSLPMRLHREIVTHSRLRSPGAGAGVLLDLQCVVGYRAVWRQMLGRGWPELPNTVCFGLAVIDGVWIRGW